MTVDIIMRKTPGSMLGATDTVGREAMEALKPGDYLVTIKKPRNVAHHRKLFALLSLIQKNQTRYQTVEELLDAIKVYTGHCTVMQLRDGTEVRIPKSIAFHALDQVSFEAFYERVIQLAIEHFIPGLAEGDLRRELADLVGLSEPQRAA